MSFREEIVKRKRRTLRDDGNILIMSIVIVALLVATGLGYMKWSSDERWDTAYEEATVQAYFLAQAGLIERGLVYLRQVRATQLPTGTVYLGPGFIKDAGDYFNVKVVRVLEQSQGNVFQRSDTYDIYSTGRAEFESHQIAGRSYGRRVRVERDAKLRARLRSFSNYMYLTNYEVTQWDEVIWFWTEDSLWGRTHSNDFIGLKYSPHFFGPISTCRDRFLYYAPDRIYFAYPPQFEVSPVMFPRTAETLRANASPWVSSNNGQFMTRVWFQSEQGIYIYQYPHGLEEEDKPSLYQPGENVVNRLHLGVQSFGAIFIDGQAEVYGCVRGMLSLGTSGNMYLVDNIWYDGTSRACGDSIGLTFPHMLGLISESNIIIRDNRYNGKNDGFGQYSPQSIDNHSITICAGMVALDESFTFEHQNDEWNSYQGTWPDERGIIHLRGAVTQWRRGYVHRSNHGPPHGTGYGKDYKYDFRFDEYPPPYYLEAMDEEGRGMFDIMSWGELKPQKRR